MRVQYTKAQAQAKKNSLVIYMINDPDSLPSPDAPDIPDTTHYRKGRVWRESGEG
jgi:hypothetical protein